MAVTSLWAIKGRIDHLINYVENPEKTRADTADDKDLQALWDIVGYTTRPDKTEQKLFVDGINCLPEIAVQEMVLVKKHFRKEDGRLAYHGYLSFKPGEVTPERCQGIGIALAQEMWGDRFQVVVSTHLDREHLHCHFAVNSVSFVDGLKYDRTNSEYDRMREIADRLCAERGLSVIKDPPKKKTPRMIYFAEKNGEPTRYNVYRQAIDNAVAASMTSRDLERYLKIQGFEIKMAGKYWSIKMIGDSRSTRLYHLGERYANGNITKRIYEGGLLKRPVTFYVPPKPNPQRVQFYGNIQKAKKLTGFRALYFHYLYLFGVLPREKPRTPRHPILWEEVRKMEQYAAQIKLLCINKIDTSPQLQAYKDKTQSKMDDLINQRSKIQNKLRRAKEPEVIANLKAQKSELTAQITVCRKDLKLCDGIAENTRRMKVKMAVIREFEKSQQQQKPIKKERGHAR